MQLFTEFVDKAEQQIKRTMVGRAFYRASFFGLVKITCAENYFLK